MKYPKPWLAAVLGFFAQPLGFLYVAKPGWASIYFFVPMLVGMVAFLSGWLSLIGDVLTITVAILAAIHAWQIARKIPEGCQRPAYSRWYGLLAWVIGAAVLIFLFRVFLFEPFRISSGSMMPSLQHDHEIVVQKWGYGHYGTFGITVFRMAMSKPLERGDVVVFEYPPNPAMDYVKRIIGVPGDIVTMRGSSLSINGQEVARERLNDTALGQEQYREHMQEKVYLILHRAASERLPLQPINRFPFAENCQYANGGLQCSVPAGHYFVLGDNRDDSKDSRYWGFVPQANIIGKMVYVTP
ncbi:MAG: signal peptidase I [Azonexus sp.]|jgi:signal peptidase I|nr:signal peptidase I [Azonexus sp.]